MAYRLNYCWRLIATGLSFALIGLGGTLIAVVISVSMALIPYGTYTKHRVSRKAISAAFRLYINFMRLCGLLTYEIRGKEHLAVPGRLVVANHPSLLDVVFLLSVIRNADCIVKEGLRSQFFMRAPISAAGYIGNDDPRLIEQCKASLARESSLIVFPEGTRTRPACALKFQRGAANIAIAARSDITPILIECHPATLLKHQKWYQIAPDPPHYVLTALPPIAIEPYLDEERMQSWRARRLTAFLEDYFLARLGDENDKAPAPGHCEAGLGLSGVPAYDSRRQ